MITESNFKDLLINLGFTKKGDIFSKEIKKFSVELKADFKDKKLIYPSEIKGGTRNDGFDKPENFVVFECVLRLLEKGYRPEHIELEKVWTLGHDPKSGRADICVTGLDNNMLFIVECKKAGKAFDDALKDTLADGAQLFSYWQQERATKWLILYASDFDGKTLSYKAPSINCSDDPNIATIAKKDKTIKLFDKAFTAQEKYVVWKETYSCRLLNDVVFSNDSIAYKIGIKPLLKKNLRDFKPEDKIVNKFEEILRHNNVSDKENAFNRLIALFICKLVDEITKGENDEVEFQYKQGTDTYETLQDRLQRLHQEGMEQFMKEKIFYVPSDYPDWLFSTYTGQKREKAIEDLKEKIRILKFYSNNDFAFKDVHNEELFYQNGKILVEVVQLFQEYRIVYPSKHQFLGDLFEQLLNKGFKQNEGQFFTPMPITRFIWDSLPIEETFASNESNKQPKVIDYACGAGHFLTEGVEAINTLLKTENNEWIRESIYGIEKDYRLARVSKISLFMNGAGEGNIIFGDGLENTPEKGIEQHKFDILVANPPYSVSAFKQHLQLKNNSFDLLKTISENSGEIEVLFVERIAQLLKPDGIAAVILPSSILSNDTDSYTGAREQFLNNFKIRAIVQLGGKTFGATNTNTVVMFLQKYHEPPKQKDLVFDSIQAIFSGANKEDWTDKEIFEEYISKISVSEDDYLDFINEKTTLEEFKELPYFNSYVESFEKSTELKNLIKTKSYSSKTKADQLIENQKLFYSIVKNIEKEKMYFYALTYKQKTIVVTAPSDNNEQKKFLGYDWSTRKGNEGIQILSPGGKLYNDLDRKDGTTIASLIRSSYMDLFPAISEENAKYVQCFQTSNMLDFSRSTFNKAIRTTLEKALEIKSKYPLKPMSSFASVSSGNSAPQDEKAYDKGKFPFFRVSDVAKFHINPNLTEANDLLNDEGIKGLTLFNKGTILFPKSGASTYLDHRAIMGVDGYVVSHLATIKPDTTQINTNYLFELLCMIHAKEIKPSSGYPSLNAGDLENLRLPLPPMPIQESIANECGKVDKDIEKVGKKIIAQKDKINTIFNDLDAKATDNYQLSSKANFEILIGRRVLNSQLLDNGKYPVFSANVNEPFGYLDNLLIKDFSKDSILFGIDGEWMTRHLPKDIPFVPTDHCGVVRVLTPNINPKYFAHLLEVQGSISRFSRSYRASIDRIEGLSVKVPSIQEQNAAVEEIMKLEKEISKLEKELETLSSKKVKIIKDNI